MKRTMMILILTLFIIGCVYGQDNNPKINGVTFELPDKYLGGDAMTDGYRLNNTFSIRCIDDNVPNAMGLWAVEHDYSKDLKIGNHPVRHYCQYNSYVGGNDSHAYFASDESIYEINWVGDKITKDIESIIKNTPKSKIDEYDFYNALNKSVEIYKIERVEKLNHDAEYNYLESKFHSQYGPTSGHDTHRFKEILLTYYN